MQQRKPNARWMLKQSFKRTVRINIKTHWLFLIKTHESPGFNFLLNIVTRIPIVMSHM